MSAICAPVALIAWEREKMNKPTVMEELAWCEIELDNIKAGLFSMYSQDYIEGAISALNLAKEGEDE